MPCLGILVRLPDRQLDGVTVSSVFEMHGDEVSVLTCTEKMRF